MNDRNRTTELAMFRNLRKRTEKSPDFTGTLKVNRPIEPGEYYIGAWAAESKKGTKYLSFGDITPKGKGDDAKPARQKRNADDDDDLDDEIPF